MEKLSGESVISLEHVTKTYRLGVIGTGTLRGDLESFTARLRHREDPNRPVGETTHSRGELLHALNDVSLTVRRGETLGLIGPNGAGKTTLLKLLSRVTAPTAGTIRIRGKLAGMLEVGTGFHPELTGRENIYLNGAIMGMSRAEITRRLDEIVAFAELEPFLDTPVKRYSAGMYVRLAFSVAAHLDADILLMDEVLAVGDAPFRLKCVEKIHSLVGAQDRTVIFVSHDMDTVSRLCDRCALLREGRLAFLGDTDRAIAQYHGLGETGSNRFDMSDRRRSRGLVPAMLEVVFPGLPAPEAPAGTAITGRLIWQLAEPQPRLCLRLTLSWAGTAIVTCLAPAPEETLAPGRYETEFHLDTAALTPGEYTADLSLYHYDEAGIHNPVDHVDRAFTLRVTRGRYGNDSWNRRDFGPLLADGLTLGESRQVGGAGCEN